MVRGFLRFRISSIDFYTSLFYMNPPLLFWYWVVPIFLMVLSCVDDFEGLKNFCRFNPLLDGGEEPDPTALLSKLVWVSWMYLSIMSASLDPVPCSTPFAVLKSFSAFS